LLELLHEHLAEDLKALKEESFKRTAKTQAIIDHKESYSKSVTQFYQLFPGIIQQLITRMGTKVTWRPWVVSCTGIIVRNGR
jgi:hypothetical protein